MTPVCDSTGQDMFWLTDRMLRDWPLPLPSADGDKEVRGRALLIGGSRQMPGAIILAANAALRAGAGKLTVATTASVAQLVASAIPESRVIALPEMENGGLMPHAADLFDALTGKMDAVLVGPGMLDEVSICAFVRELLPKFSDTKVVLDAYAMSVVRGIQAYQEGAENMGEAHLILTPHAGEMAHLCGAEKAAVQADPATAARDGAKNWNAVVAMKGATTYIASPTGGMWRHEGGNVGLAISGSGDTLAGIITGLAARGATLEQATAWGVALHARAGQLLAQRIGSLGYFAREIAAEIPALMDQLRHPES